MAAESCSADWTARFRALRDALRADVACVVDLRAVHSRRDELERLLSDLDSQLERVAHAAVITLVGATGAGKSTLLNALVGRPIAREGVDRPTTHEPVIYAPRDADLTDLLGVDDGAPSPVVVRYDPAPAEWAHVLVDAPDLNSVAEAHRAHVAALAERSDVLVVVVHRQSVVEEAPVSFLDAFAQRRALLFVLNRADELTATARAALLQQVRALADSRWQASAAPVIAVSARRAQVDPRAPDLIAVRGILMDMVRARALERVRRHNAVGTASLIGALFRRVGAEALPDLDALPHDVDTGSDALAGRLASEAGERWMLRRAELNRVSWAEAAARWDGPGGWALRVGGVSSAGLGAGALLVRRHPLLAAGAALGSATAEELHRVAERRQLAQAASLLPTPNELATWYADALSAARVRAGRLTGSPGALGIPSADDVYAVAADAVETAWLGLVSRELPAAAERSLLRFFRLPLDLPLYALAALTVYRVAVGFVNAEYVGVDFLVNAGLLGAAYLFCVGLVVRRGLAWRCHILVRRAIEGCRMAMNRWVDTTRAGVRTHCTEQRAALERLMQLEAQWLQSLEAPTPGPPLTSASAPLQRGGE